MPKLNYANQADELLKSWNMTFTSELIGADCPRFCEDARAGRNMGDVSKFPRKTHIHGKHYRCTFAQPGKSPLIIEFWNSYADEEYNAFRTLGFHERNERRLKPWTKRNAQGELVTGYWAKTPTAYDVLASLEKYPVGGFSEFCREFGYDEDSRQAEPIWRSCADQFERVSRFFSLEQLEQVREIA